MAENMVDEATAVELAQRIIEAGREPFRVGPEEFVCTLSVGVASTADSQRAAEDLLREADLALYRAKDRGRDRAEIFDEELQTKAVGRLVTERMLRRALDEGGLVVEYQPIIDLRTGAAVGSEALVRMRDPNTQGLLQPSAFLDVAEESGLLIAMDERVLADAVMQVSGWRRRLAGTQFVEVAINVTARHLADVGFQTIDRATNSPPTASNPPTFSSRSPSGSSWRPRIRPSPDYGDCAEARRPGRLGRFRHRVLVVGLSASVPSRFREDRQVVHRRHGAGGRRIWPSWPPSSAWPTPSI